MADAVPMPAALAERARRFYAEGAVPVQPRRAATVVLLRDAPGGPEAFLVRRRATMAFASGMYAFPGGGVDPRDGAVDSSVWAGPDPVAWSGLLGLPVEAARGVVTAAVRETFEETGVLFADPIPAGLSLVERRDSLVRLLIEHRMVMRTDLLHGWARWITPEFEPRRYDTVFFLAALPPGQQAREVGGEADRVQWIRPADALSGYESGELAMLPPTVAVLRSLSGFRRVADALGTPAPSLAPVLPRVEWAAGGARLVL